MFSQKTEPWGARTGIFYVFFRLVIALLLVLLALVGANLYLLQKPVRVPYLINLDALTMPRRIDPIEALSQTDERLIKAELRRFIFKIRTLSTDKHLQDELYDAASAYVAPAARANVDRWLGENETPDILRRAVRINAVLTRPEGGYTVHWTEIHSGRTSRSKESWEAVIRLEQLPHLDENNVLENPLGLQVVAFDAIYQGSEPVEVIEPSTWPEKRFHHQP